MGKAFLVVLVLLLGLPQNCFSSDFLVVEFENTVVETRTEKKGSFEIPIVLFRAQGIANGIQKVSDGPDFVEVSSTEFERVKDSLATGHRSPGSLSKTMTLTNGTKVIAGEYMYMEYLSDKFRNESREPGRNYLLEAFKQAEERTAKDKKSSFKGPMWESMVKALSTPESARYFGIVSELGYSKKEWGQFFKYLQSEGYIQHLPDLNNVHSLGHSEYYQYGDTLLERKSSILVDMVKLLDRAVLARGESRHSLIFAEGVAPSFSRVYKSLYSVVKGMGASSKLILVNTGLPSEVRSSNVPEVFLIEQGGPKKLSYSDSVNYAGSILSYLSSKNMMPKPRSCKEIF